MDLSGVIARMEAEWDSNGFFDQIRNGLYDADRARDILGVLRAIDIGDDELVPKRLVALLWYLPSFLEWQKDRVSERGGDTADYKWFVTEARNTLEEVLGTP